MTTKRKIDFSALDGIIAEGIINQHGEQLRYALQDLIKQQASREEMERHVLEELDMPTWKKTMIQWGVVFDYLEKGRGEE